MRVKKGITYELKDGRKAKVTSFNITDQEVTIEVDGTESHMDYQSFKALVIDADTDAPKQATAKEATTFRLRNNELATITKLNKTRVCYTTESGRENEVSRKEYDTLVEHKHIELL